MLVELVALVLSDELALSVEPDWLAASQGGGGGADAACDESEDEEDEDVESAVDARSVNKVLRSAANWASSLLLLLLLLLVDDDDELSEEDVADVVDAELSESKSVTSWLRSFSSAESPLLALDESDDEVEDEDEEAELLLPN